HQSVLSGGLGHGHLRHHGAGAPGQAGRSVREDGVMVSGIDTVPAAARDGSEAAGMAVEHRILFAALFAFLLVAPFVLYPVFLMKVLCFALFASAFNLLLGYGGLLSFGHAAFFGTASYAAAHSAKVWG